MTFENIKKAKAEAQRFIQAANRVLTGVDFGTIHIICGTKDSGALRRCSMNLTRSLADLRKP